MDGWMDGWMDRRRCAGFMCACIRACMNSCVYTYLSYTCRVYTYMYFWYSAHGIALPMANVHADMCVYKCVHTFTCSFFSCLLVSCFIIGHVYLYI